MRTRVTSDTPYERLPSLLTLKEAAVYTGYSYGYLLKAFHLSRFPISAKRIGRFWRVPKEQFNAKIERTFK